MAALEDRHWWFVGRRRFLQAVIDRFVQPPAGSRILEAGCGTGGNLRMLSRWGEVAAFDPHDDARIFAQGQTAADVRAGSLPGDIPFEPGSFDLIAALDVLEHLGDETASLRALAARLRPGGRLLITVPAFGFLWSRHDVQHHHRRRYTRASLIAAARAAGLAPVRVTYFNTLLFGLVAGVRLAKNALRIEGDEDVLPPRPVNRLLAAIFSAERFLLGRVPLPFGVSLLMIARPSYGDGL